jgi:hypothetical protein
MVDKFSVLSLPQNVFLDVLYHYSIKQKLHLHAVDTCKFLVISRSRVANVQSTGANVDTVQVLDDIASMLSELRETLLSHNKRYMKENGVCDQGNCT